MSRWSAPLTGAGRALGKTAASMTIDLASAAAHIGEAAFDSASGRPRSEGVLRVQVLILSDETGRPLSTPERVHPALATADRVLREHAGVRVRVTDVRTISEIPPGAALDPRANRGLVVDDLLGRTAFYRRHLTATADQATNSLIGAPITVVVVRRIAGNTTGCSLGLSADWVIAQAALFDETDPYSFDDTVLAHELGHAMNLPHHRDRDNLMFAESSPPQRIRGTRLTSWQRRVLQANRHVVPGRSGGGPQPG